MASLENRNGNYRVVFRYAGRRFSRSLDTNHIVEARASIARLEDNLRRLELGLLALPSGVDISTFLLSDGRITVASSHSEVQTLGELFDLYFASVPSGSLEANTLYLMQIHAKRLKHILGANTMIGSLRSGNLQGYIGIRGQQKSRNGRLISPTTIRKELATFRTVWNWNVTMGHVAISFPGHGLKFPKLESKPPFRTLKEIKTRINRGALSTDAEERLWESVYLSLPEIAELLSHVKKTSCQPYLYPMFVFAAHTGARRSEMIRSEIDDIDIHNRVVHLRKRKRIRGVKSTRTVPLSAQLQEVLSGWLESHPGGNFTFATLESIDKSNRRDRESGSLTRDVCQKHFRRVLSDSRFAKLRGWHVLRHSFCSNCAARGIDQRVINAWVGHQSEEMVRRYRHLLPSQSRESIELVFGNGR